MEAVLRKLEAGFTAALICLGVQLGEYLGRFAAGRTAAALLDSLVPPAVRWAPPRLPEDE